jgi:hypothetical protein
MRIIVVGNSNQGYDIPEEGLVLWYGLAADVPEGWAIYSTAFDVLVMGASAGDKNLTPAGALTHIHTNTSPTGSEASHGHGASLSFQGSSGSHAVFSDNTNYNTSASHSNHTNSGAGTNSAGIHTHTVSDVGSETNLPAHRRLFWIERTP